ncbi:helix-turn-helix domain-containing protein [Lihuaxuella thermophila]|uniref:Tetratricopeptide repeat-containing protein n=1 Tax=Lihuaxuella thermophila TaxID=1173111 RepID=A0A1H8D6H0_9BACL|nr:tetratricopeptide repeat protein [Lihuaxuella thermophila]SEN02819.1 Tetratricopeptide repeat-containing protein [Lihuaxuella thermophila]
MGLLDQLDKGIISYAVRKKRNEKGLTQEKLSDNTVSDSTISNLENQEANVKEDKIIHIFEKLGVPKEQIPHHIKEIQTEIESLQFKLEFIESLIEKGDLEGAFERINQISLEDYHPLAAYTFFLKGRYLYRNKEWDKAERQFLHAIKISQRNKIKHKDNILAMCYNELSRCRYNQNDLKEAVSYVDQGLNEVDESLEKNDIKYPLIINKIYYSLRSFQNDQAFQLLNEVWPLIPHIPQTQLILDLYKFRAILLRKSQNYSEAIQCCKEGIRLGYRKNPTRTMDLLLILGSIHLKRNEFKEANEYFQMAVCLDKSFEFPRRHIDAYIYLSILYSAQEEWSEAYKYLNKAIEKGREIKDVFRLTKALLVRGNCHLKQQEYEKAASYFQEAADLSNEHGHRNHQRTAYFKMAQCFGKLGKVEEFSECTKKLFFLQHEIFEGEDDDYEFI